MELTITLDQSDWAEFQTYISNTLPKHHKSSKRSIVSQFWFWVVLTSVLIITLGSFSAFHWPSAGVTAIVFVIFFALFLVELNSLQKVYAPSEKGVFVGEHHFKFDEDGIHSRGVGYEGRHAWSLVKRIERTDKLIMLFWDTAYAFIFPLDKLENPDEVYAYLEEKFKNSG